jgi:hypothetical protein
MLEGLNAAARVKCRRISDRPRTGLRAAVHHSLRVAASGFGFSLSTSRAQGFDSRVRCSRSIGPGSVRAKCGSILRDQRYRTIGRTLDKASQTDASLRSGAMFRRNR